MQNANETIVNANAEKNSASVELTVKVKNLAVFPHDETSTRDDVVLGLYEPIANIIKTDDGGFDVGEVAKLKIDRAAFVAQLANASTVARFYLVQQPEGVVIGKSELGTLMLDAELKVKRTYVEADGITIMHNRFETEILSVKIKKLSLLLAWKDLKPELADMLLAQQ